jgi:MYXO-CTERM domain-containing protein
MTINSATLSFQLLDGYPGTQGGQITAFGGDGSLEYQYNAPAQNYGTQTVTMASGLNSIDVTSLLQVAALEGEDWFNLLLQGNDTYQWTYTFTGSGYSNDRAQLRLAVDAAVAVSQTPLPAAAPMLASALGLGGLIGWRRRRAHRQISA